jgi:hypothetical protein
MDNKKIAKPIVIAAILVFSVLLVPVSATVYDFKDTTNNKAYEGTDNLRPAEVPPNYEVELDISHYEKINTSDGNIANYTNSTGFNFHRFAFTIKECIASILRINVTYEGYGSATMGYGVYLYIWNYTNLSWEVVGQHTNGTAVEIISKNYTSGFSNYINATGYLQLLAQTSETQSCPFLYVWDGTSYHFVTDTNSGGRIGATYPRNPWPEDYVKIDGSELKAENGAYRLELAEDQDEITYLDSVRLIAVDHQPGVELYSTPRINNPEYSTVLPYTLTIRNPRVPVSATDEHGRDVLPLISAVDRKYTDAHQNYFDTVTIDFGDLSGATKIKLLYNAYVDWPDTGSSGRRENSSPYVEVINEAGEWERVSDDEHFHNAQAKPRTTVLDITDWFKTDDYRIRINNWYQVYIDYIAVDTSEDEAVTATEVPPAAANLYWKGVSVQTSPDGHEPLIPDFYSTMGLSGFRTWTGKFTKYGNVLPLVTERDDKFVVMHAGDSVSIAFNEVPVPEGMERDYYLVSDAYYKDKGNSVDPLPFHSMSDYPYPGSESYPNDDEHRAYLAEYNTREFGSMSGEEGHHTIYTDYVSVEIIPKPAALEGNKTVWDPVNETWVKELTAKMNHTLQFNCTITNIGGFNLTNIRFWDIMDCSLRFEGDQMVINGVPQSLGCDPYCFKPKVLHPDSCDWNLSNPRDYCFTELCPSNNSRCIRNWDDTNHDGNVSACDQIYLTSDEPKWYHVDRVPYTLNLSNATYGTKYFDSVLNWDDPEMNLSDPINSTWLEVCCCKDHYTLIDWTDQCPTPGLSEPDLVTLRNERTQQVVEYTVKEMVKDLVVSREWEINDFPCETGTLEPSHNLTFLYNATVVRCGVDNNTFVAKGIESHPHAPWVYSDPAVVTITVPCPDGDATESTGFIKDEYTLNEDVYATGSNFDPGYNGIMDIYVFDDYDWYEGLDIASLPPPYAWSFNVSIDANGNVGPIKIWNKGETFVGEFDLFFDANGDGKYTQGIDAVDNFHDPGFIIIGEVPALMPQGIATLMVLLSIIAIGTIARKKRR